MPLRNITKVVTTVFDGDGVAAVGVSWLRDEV
jgi:hypothetical protein